MALDTAKAEVILRCLTVKFVNAVAGATPFYPQVCTTVDSSGRDEKYAMLGNMPGVREWIGDREVKQLHPKDSRKGQDGAEERHNGKRGYVQIVVSLHAIPHTFLNASDSASQRSLTGTNALPVAICRATAR